MPRGANLHRDEIPPGTLYLLILKTLARSGEMHGYEIANSIQRTSDDQLTPAGRQQLTLEMTQFERVMGAITRLIAAV
jgi:PadR family transcriptional regulator